MLSKEKIIENDWTWEDVIDNCTSERDFEIVEYANGDLNKLLDNL